MNDLTDAVAATMLVAATLFFSFVLFLAFIPLVALFFLWLWNDVMLYLHLPHTITYWQSIKLCFFIYVIKGLFGMKVTASSSNG